MIVCRGVRMFLGCTEEEGGEAVLRPVESLCGLTLGGHDPFDDWDFAGGEVRQLAHDLPRLRLIFGGAGVQPGVDLGDPAVDESGTLQGVSGEGQLCLP